MANKRQQENSQESGIVEAKRAKLVKSITSSDRPGKINKIHLRNFMCHSSLKVDFNKNINFVIGRNGSGKSAILTALIVVLGGRASNTNRSTSMKEFIKKGCAATTIDIEINNIGPFAYKKDIFGDSILVSRQLNSSGTSSFKIKSDSGNIISTKKCDLLKITSHLKIMIDNPLSVLTQDTARTFLNSSDPKKRYIFFTKATSLDYIKATIQEIVAVIRKSNEQMQKYKEKQESLKSRVEEIRKQLAKFKSIDSLEQTKKNIEIEILWSNIMKIEKEKSSELIKLEEKLNEIVDMEKQISEEDNIKKSLNSKIQSFVNSLKEKQSDTEKLRSFYNEIKINLKSEKDVYQQKAETLKQTKASLMKINNSQNIIMQEIENKEKQLSIWQELKEQKEQKMKTLLAREEELKHFRQVTQVESSTFFGNNAKLQDDIERITVKLNQLNGKINQTTSILRQLNNQSCNVLSLYGTHIPELLEMIKKAHQAGKFTELPRGPIGSYIKVNNKAWAGVIEKTLGVSFLKGFLVSNSQDGQTLVKIIKKCFPSTPLPIRISSKFIHKVHDISRSKAHSDKSNGILNFFDAITVSDPVVANCLIDQHNIERLLLFESEDKAMQFMSQADMVPKNSKMAILKDGTIYYPVPNYRMYYGDKPASHLLEINIKGRQIQLQQELEEYQAEVANYESNLTDIKNQCSIGQKEVARLNSQIKEYDNETYQIQNKLRELKNEEEPSEGSVSLLKEEFDILSKKENDLKNSLHEIEDDMKRAKCCIQELNENINQAKSQVLKSEEACLSMQDKIDQLEQSKRTSSKKGTLETKINTVKQQCEEIKKQVNCLEEKLSELMNGVDEATRPSTVRTIAYLNEQLQQIKSSIRSVNACALDPAKLQKEYDEKLSEYEKEKLNNESHQDALNELTAIVNMRHKVFLKLRAHMTSQVQQYFAFMLRLRKYQGIININHEEQTLEIEIDPQSKNSKTNENQNSKNKKTLRDLRSLSGGERSYSTVSFLVALWNCMNLPFYFLDEFDVFMDHINRKVVMDVLIQSANSNLHKQYVFLTPQDTSSITASDTLKIHKMADPER
ncbi:structural maintenance of chromosomes protein 6-like [Ctenocephalides felis]|uniref:structural maintenance of chromosomes protein 6-like n=1 Tax=Ctenocephalides felis TaxID=7515 RepID=UPI000E6E1BB4|nr:structural maintenance of chromosomes protein 6-like [Ctenocephalides felis]XP_026478876.1 structural maintenance of chromosomes protein 6-like [Ctenocephalides felis]XP_026478877.1 structural maintenance of chromosomes protein 6-like [Ctenocephalides felis]